MTAGTRDRFVHIADLHFWRIVRNPLRLLNKRFLGNLNVIFRRSRDFDMGQAEAFADAVAATGVSAAVLTGDFTSTALEEEFRLAAAFVTGLETRGLAVHLVPGNHDVYTFEAQRAQRFEQHFAEYLPTAGYPVRVDLPGGTGLVLVASVRPNWLSARGWMTAEEIAAVGRLVEEAPAGPVVVASHYPLYPATYGYASSAQHRLVQRESLRARLAATGRDVLYLCGHVHRFSYVRDEDASRLVQLSTGGFFRHNPAEGSAGEFSEVALGEGGIGVHRHLFRGGAWERRAVSCRIHPGE